MPSFAFLLLTLFARVLFPSDLFPHCTVLFADIAGFTAWSSLRDPAQVFTLLESIYSAFDQIARKRGVFKVRAPRLPQPTSPLSLPSSHKRRPFVCFEQVETVGDSYVAVTGLPEPQEDHAIIMARFARDCKNRMNEVTRQLELTLGPDTGDLAMRFGLHSGPVTAGTYLILFAYYCLRRFSLTRLRAINTLFGNRCAAR